MFKLNQETIAIVTVGLALAGLDVTSDNSIREEIRAVRTEARADREAFEKHITRLTQEQSRLTGMVEQMRTASADR